jgi:hypothetical protein
VSLQKVRYANDASKTMLTAALGSLPGILEGFFVIA